MDKQGQLENSGKYKNSFATWRKIVRGASRVVLCDVQHKGELATHTVALYRCQTDLAYRVLAAVVFLDHPLAYTLRAPRTVVGGNSAAPHFGQRLG